MKASLFHRSLDDMTRTTGMHLYTTRMIYDCILLGESSRAREATIAKAVRDGVIERFCRGLYAFRAADCRHDLRHEAVLRLRPGRYSYVSCESALSSWGIITQRMLGAITVMTSGRRQRFAMPSSSIILTHTAKPYTAVLPHLVPPGDDDLLPTAKPRLAYRDLKRTGGCADMVDIDELNDVAEEVGDAV